MKKITIINPEKVSDKEAKKYKNRRASRAIVLDNDGKIALLYVSKKKYYKLPGGKMEKGESRIETLKRECWEEIGCNLEIIGEIGFIVEYRKMLERRQTSYCYLAKVKGRQEMAHLSKKEKEEGYKLKWLSYNNAVKVMEKSKKISKEGNPYVISREIAFLKEAKAILNK